MVILAVALNWMLIIALAAYLKAPRRCDEYIVYRKPEKEEV
jgi:hypothetical protein